MGLAAGECFGPSGLALTEGAGPATPEGARLAITAFAARRSVSPYASQYGASSSEACIGVREITAEL